MKNIFDNIQISGRSLTLALALLLATTAYAQKDKTITGRVVDSKGQPVAGAIVNIAEESRISLTDVDGLFELKKVSKDDEICASCLGYKNAQVKVKFDGSMEIVLEDDADEFMHTMPTPFTRKAKKLITEATSVVSGEELQKHPVTILQNAFTSTVNGMETYEWSSEPGWSETAMYIRGIRTMNTSARSPLVIVDNVERDLSFLDAFPIENITILKDAAAASIYGMRGANGVIMVTTKRGEPGRTKIDFTQEVGFQTLMNTMETQNSYNMALTRNQVRYLSGLDPLYTDEQIENYRKVCNGETLDGMDAYSYYNTNWFDQLYRSAAPQYRTNLQISGGNERARYYVSFSYLRQEGMWNETGTNYNSSFNTNHTLNRYNLRSNIDIDVNKYINVQLDLGGRIDNIKQPTTAVFNLVTFGAVEANPMEPVYCPNGELYMTSTAQNPIALLAASGQEKNRRRNLYSTVNINGDLSSILPGLKAYATVSFDSYETYESTQYNAMNTYYYDYAAASSLSSVDDIEYTRYTTYSALTDPTVNQRSYSYNLNLIGGLSYANSFGLHNVDGKVFARSYRNELAGSDYAGGSQEASDNRYLSWNAQANYNYDHRYILSLNLSRMGCDNFYPEDRWGTFWGASAGWNIAEESFFKNKWTDLLKLRLSWGHAGYADTGAGRYAYQSSYSTGTGYSFGYNATYTTGYYESVAGNSNNKWELSDMINAGLDWSFFKGKLSGQFDIFKEWRSNILVERSTIPQILGVAVSDDSYGKVESWGYELALNHQNKIGDVGYNIGFQLTYNTNKITEMDETEPDVEWQRKTGKRIYDDTEVAALYESSFNNSIGGWYMYKFVQWASDESMICSSAEDAQARAAAGQIPYVDFYPYNESSAGAQSLGTAVFKDINGDNVINENDMVAASYTMIPEYVLSLNVGLEYKGFDARAIFTAYLNRSVFLSPAISWSGWSNMGTHEVTKAWGYYTDDPTDPRNVNAKYPRPVYGDFDAVDSDRSTGTYKNDIWIVDGDYVSLRNIEIGYSLPTRTIAKANLTKCRFYFSGYNLCTWSGLPDGCDPEKPMSYCWWYPKTRSFTFGVNIGF